jgi:hypothetical protein
VRVSRQSPEDIPTPQERCQREAAFETSAEEFIHLLIDYQCCEGRGSNLATNAALRPKLVTGHASCNDRNLSGYV